MRPGGLQFPVCCACIFVAIGLGCTVDDSRKNENIKQHESGLSSAATQTFGFESTANWSPIWSNPTLELSSLHTEGISSLAVSGGGWMSIVSRKLTRQDVPESAPAVVG